MEKNKITKTRSSSVISLPVTHGESVFLIVISITARKTKTWIIQMQFGRNKGRRLEKQIDLALSIWNMKAKNEKI